MHRNAVACSNFRSKTDSNNFDALICEHCGWGKSSHAEFETIYAPSPVYEDVSPTPTYDAPTFDAPAQDSPAIDVSAPDPTPDFGGFGGGDSGGGGASGDF